MVHPKSGCIPLIIFSRTHVKCIWQPLTKKAIPPIRGSHLYSLALLSGWVTCVPLTRGTNTRGEGLGLWGCRSTHVLELGPSASLAVSGLRRSNVRLKGQ